MLLARLDHRYLKRLRDATKTKRKRKKNKTTKTKTKNINRLAGWLSG